MRIRLLALLTLTGLMMVMASAASASKETRPIFVPLKPNGSTWAIQPSDFRVSRGLALGYMTWRGWGRLRAVGHGITFIGSNKHGANATVRLRGVRTCDGRRYYAHMAVISEDVGRVDYALIANKLGFCVWAWRSSD